MKIGVDLDGVIADIMPEVRVRLKRDLSIVAESDDLSFDDLEQLNIKKGWLDKAYVDEWLWSKAIPYPENISTLRDWAEQGHEIHIITGRPAQALSLVTRGWLKRNKVPYAELTFEPTMHKVDYLIKKEIPVMFEDRFFEANKIGAFGKRSFILKRPWNERWEKSITNPLVSYIDLLSDANSFINEADNVGAG